MKRALRDLAKRGFICVTIRRDRFAAIACAEVRRKTAPAGFRAKRLDLCGNRIGFGFREHGAAQKDTVVIERRRKIFDHVKGGAKLGDRPSRRRSDRRNRVACGNDAGAGIRAAHDVRAVGGAVDTARRQNPVRVVIGLDFVDQRNGAE